MSIADQAQQLAHATPRWLDGVIILGSAAASWLAPIASLVAIFWGCLQIFSWFEKRRQDKREE